MKLTQQPSSKVTTCSNTSLLFLAPIQLPSSTTKASKNTWCVVDMEQCRAKKRLGKDPTKLEFLWILWLDLELEFCLSVMDGLYG